EVKVRVGTGKGRRVRFTALFLGEWSNTNSSGIERFRVWRGRTGKYVVHVERSADFTMVDQDGKPAGWRGYLGIGNLSYGSSAAQASLDLGESLEEVRGLVPPQLYDVVARAPGQPEVEDLDV